MYAIIEVGGKQHSVKQGETIIVEKQEAEETKVITLDKVLLIASDDKIEIGQPYLKGATVIACVLKHIKGEKLVSFKYRRRKSSHWKKGHRQELSRIQIKDIVFS
jgi:large subunit ribosomal protein L21